MVLLKIISFYFILCSTVICIRIQQMINQFNSKNLILHEYYIILLSIFTAVTLTIIILISSYFLANQKPNAEKKTAYECGFEPFEDARGKIDIKFCVLAILFVVFDLEIVFLMPWCFSLPSLGLIDFWVGIEFLLELGAGLFYIWSKKALDW
jgi:NADH-quinone oxidoreductase subunit A